MEQQIVIFKLAEEHFGVEIATVESIIKKQSITSVPHAPSFVEGVTNLRGRILPVIDLRRRFDLPPRQDTADTRIVVVSMDGTEVGLVVDGVSEVLTIQDCDIEPTPRMLTTVDSDFITGIAKLDKHLVILLDLGAVLSIQERSALQQLPVAA